MFSLGLCTIGVLVILSYHHIQLQKEEELFEGKGKLIEAADTKINVYVEGRGTDTFVFMSGAGIAAPVYELKGLYSKFSRSSSIALVERAGYGYSNETKDGREIGEILNQTRTALAKSGLKPPYILVPHSISGIEAIYWAQCYPQEIKAIIGLDIGLPHEYANHPLEFSEKLQIASMNFLPKLGIHRLFPEAVYDPEVLRQSFLNREEKEIYKAISYKKAMTDNMRQEMFMSSRNGEISASLPYPVHTPMLLLSAYKESNRSNFEKRKKENYVNFADHLLQSKVAEVKGNHSIYLYAPEEIHQLTLNFLETIEKEQSHELHSSDD
ncbi:alpha/beta hydrolase [Bacillus lacus]|uniref:Alpha/beta hydrolase n=1 Tax=Metabacillus lacus TaxID=1983721 RepID=A0A7X2J0A5_9BACI|nr:alpha/beta hydrolase [Metabacillus lacus]MRX73080.1 alpha/beta hydrolase [Metabacillus lacus]